MGPWTRLCLPQSMLWGQSYEHSWREVGGVVRQWVLGVDPMGSSPTCELPAAPGGPPSPPRISADPGSLHT